MTLIIIRNGDIGETEKIIELEPLEEPGMEPVTEPAPVVPVQEPVPA